MCERRCRMGEQWYNLRPDALAEYRIGQQQFRFWLEWDRGTMNLRDLTIKFSSYAYFIAAREWARECLMLPALVCIAPDIAQERRLAHVVRTRLAQAPGLVLWTTTEVLLNEYGPLAPIWVKTIPTQSHIEQSSILLRQIIFDRVREKSATKSDAGSPSFDQQSYVHFAIRAVSVCQPGTHSDHDTRFVLHHTLEWWKGCRRR